MFAIVLFVLLRVEKRGRESVGKGSLHANFGKRFQCRAMMVDKETEDKETEAIGDR